MRDRIEIALGELGRFLYRRAWWVIVGLLALVGVGASGIPGIEIDTSAESFLAEDDPIRIGYDRFRDQFGRDDALLVAVEPPEIFDFAFLEKLRRLHEDLENEVPHLADVQSLINARDTRGDGDQLLVDDLFEDWPETDAELAAIRERALANPLYRGFVLSTDATITTLVVELDTYGDADLDESLAGFGDGVDPADDPGDAAAAGALDPDQEREVVAIMREVLARYEAPDFEIHLAGGPLTNAELMIAMITDIVRFTMISLVVIAALLTIVFRRLAGVVIPMLASVTALLATLDVMAAAGIPLMPISEVIPSFLLAVGVGGTVHLLVIYEQRVRAGASAEDALAGALSHSGLPIAMTCLTTAGGLASFSAASLMPIRLFGILAPLGVLLTLVTTLLLAPALMAVFPLRVRVREPGYTPLSIRLLVRVGAYATRRAGFVLSGACVLLVAAILGMFQLTFNHNPMHWFPEDNPVRAATEKMNAELGGSMFLEAVIDTGRENGLHDPAVLNQIEAARIETSKLQLGDVWVSKTVSLIDVVKETHQALNENRPEAYAIPQDRVLVAQELLLFENSGSDDLEDLVDSRFQLARFTMRVPFVDGREYVPFGDAVVERFEAHLDDSVSIEVTGQMVVMGRTFKAAIETMFRSYALALAVITPLMVVLLGSLRLGLLAMLPNLFPIALTVGLMGWLGIPLEMFSLLVGAIALGLAVDDTIHFMHNFGRSYSRHGDVEQAVRETLETTGQALLFTSVVLSLGFAIYVFSAMNNLVNFGALTAFAIVMAFLSDIIVAPALMKVTARFSSIAAKARR